MSERLEASLRDIAAARLILKVTLIGALIFLVVVFALGAM